MKGSCLRVSTLLVLLNFSSVIAPTNSFAHPRRSDVLGSGADTLVEDKRVLDEYDELVWTLENDKPYTFADEASPDALSRKNHKQERAKDVTIPRAAYSNSDAFTNQRTLPYGVHPGHGVQSYLSEPLGSNLPPRITRLSLRTGPLRGGTFIEITGTGFVYPPTERETCRFANVAGREAAGYPSPGAYGGSGWVDADSRENFGAVVVPAITISKTTLKCETPPRLIPGIVVVTVAVDGLTYSSDVATVTQKGTGGFGYFEYVDQPYPTGYFAIDNATGAFGGGTVVSITVNKASPNDTTTNYSYPAFGELRVELFDEAVTVTTSDGTVLHPNTTDPPGIWVDEYATATATFYDQKFSQTEIPVDIVKGTDEIGYVLVDGGLIQDDVVVTVDSKDTETVKGYTPFQPSKHAKCLWTYDHLGPHDAVYNLTNETKLNASEIRTRVAGTFFGDCYANCALEPEWENHVEFTGNYSWKGFCPINITNVTELNLTQAELIYKFGERWSPYDIPIIDYFGEADENTNFSRGNELLRNCSFVPFIPVRVQTTTLNWLGYNRAQCKTPQQTMPPSNRTYGPNVTDLNVTVSLRVSNDGYAFSDPLTNNGTGIPFSYIRGAPDVYHAFTRQVAGKFKARGPFSGNTELYLNGTQFIPSEFIVARVSTWILNETMHWSKNRTKETGRCFFDTPEQIRCATPTWYPYEQYYEWQKGGYEPCFETFVEVSNDAGLTWSEVNMAVKKTQPLTDKKAPSDLRAPMFFYCPVYVSPYGHNEYGAGTPMLPFRDVSRAIQATLSYPRAYWIAKGYEYPGKYGVYDQTKEVEELSGRRVRGGEPRGRGIGEYVNHDQIVVQEGGYLDVDAVDGRYGPERNLNLDPGGRVIEIVTDSWAFFSGRGANWEAQRWGSDADKNEKDAEQKGVLYYNVGLFVNGVMRWETFEGNGARSGNGSDVFFINRTASEVQGSGRRRLLGVGDGNGFGSDPDASPTDSSDLSENSEQRIRRHLLEMKHVHAVGSDGGDGAETADDGAARRRRYQGSRG